MLEFIASRTLHHQGLEQKAGQSLNWDTTPLEDHQEFRGPIQSSNFHLETLIGQIACQGSPIQNPSPNLARMCHLQ